MKQFALLFFVALIASAASASAVLVFDKEENSTTVIRQAPLDGGSQASREGLTPREIYKRDAPGVVFISARVAQAVPSPFGMPQQQEGTSTGSGFVVDKQGFIFTNAHVVNDAQTVSVRFGDDKELMAKVVGIDPSNDLALLKIDTSGLDLKPLKLANSSRVQVGDPVIAIGNPFGLDRTLTTGVASALQRRITAPNGFSIANVIQTDAAINPGNSGGPLINAFGEVVGINSQIATGGEGNGNVGIGFAVPSNTVKEVLPLLKKNGKVSRAYLGIQGVDISDSLKQFNLAAEEGVLVQKADTGDPAGRAGIKGGIIESTSEGQNLLLGGDIIVRIDDEKITSMEEISRLVDSRRPGDRVKVEIIRESMRRVIPVTLGERPTEVLPLPR